METAKLFRRVSQMCNKMWSKKETGCEGKKYIGKHRSFKKNEAR